MCDLAGSGSRIVRKEKKISIEKYFDESEWVDLKKKKKKKKGRASRSKKYLRRSNIFK